ncbi:MAG: LysM peptidoglycan-binding domain-containing protein [Lawsonibacter sp.]|nr:LysM peptidoglycan-binding domain-containing protein [Lawsonibacter sp.]
MDIHVVRPGDTLYSIALQYGVAMSQLIHDNQLPDPSRLVVGQTLVVQYPAQTHTVQAGDTLASIAAMHAMTVRQLLRNNPVLQGESQIIPGQVLVITYRQAREGTLSVNGYAYPYIDKGLLQRTLPYLSDLTPFTYGFTPQGALIPLQDQALLDATRQMGVRPLLHLSTLTEEGGFSNELAHIALTNPAVQTRLISELLNTIAQKGYQGLDVDFEFVYGEDAQAYAQFVSRLRAALSPRGLPVIVALAPKVYDAQPGRLYEGHSYRLLSQAADFVLLMTYEWGYTYGPPMAVAPIRNVRQVVEYALTEMPAGKIYLGVPNYGYDWPLPFQQGSKAISISNQYAVELAAKNRVAIRFDTQAQSPWFRYTDGNGQEHEVWFEDARSIRAKLALTQEYGLHGVGYWNLMRPFPQNWLVLNALYNIRDEASPEAP